MPKSMFVDFKAVRASITMEQVLEHYGLLNHFTKRGDSLFGPCPIHKGSNPTQFKVSISKNLWNCFSECKHGGNVLDFIAKMENASIHAAAVKAIEWFNLDPDAVSGSDDRSETESGSSESEPTRAPAKRAMPPEEPAAPNKPLKFRLDKLDREHPYIKERGITLETIVDFGAGYCSKGTMEGRIAIPIHTLGGEVVGYAGRYAGEPNGEPKYKLPQGFRKSLELFNIHRAIKEPAEKPLVIVEGFFDCMKLYQHGYRKVVALMGSTLSAAQEKMIRKHTNPESRVILLLDEDDAGRAGREDIAVRLAKFCFVKIHAFGVADTQPENLTQEELEHIFGGEL